MTLADGKVVLVVRRRDLDGSGAEVGLDPVVDDDGDFAAGEGKLEGFSVEMSVALVKGVHGDSDIAEHGFGPGGGDSEEFAGRTDDGVANFPELTLLFFVRDFEIADGGLTAGAPVDDVGAAIDEAVFVKADEGFAHGDGEVLVHGVVLARPVDGVADALHGGEDGAAVVAAPLADALNEDFAAEGLPGCAFADEQALDEHLRGDAGVIGAGKPEGGFAEHAMPADEDIRLRVLEHVPHMEIAGDVGRGQKDGEGAIVRADRRRFDFEEALLDPIGGPPLFDGGGIVRFGELAARPHCAVAFEGGFGLLGHSLFTI